MEFPESFSPLLKDLLLTMLDKDPTKRPSALELLEHAWFQPQVLDDANEGEADLKANSQ